MKGYLVIKVEENEVHLERKNEKSVDLEIFIHTSESSFFLAMGHVDICYQGQVISYGSYDPSFRTLVWYNWRRGFYLRPIVKNILNFVREKARNLIRLWFKPVSTTEKGHRRTIERDRKSLDTLGTKFTTVEKKGRRGQTYLLLSAETRG